MRLASLAILVAWAWNIAPSAFSQSDNDLNEFKRLMKRGDARVGGQINSQHLDDREILYVQPETTFVLSSCWLTISQTPYSWKIPLANFRLGDIQKAHWQEDDTYSFTEFINDDRVSVALFENQGSDARFYKSKTSIAVTFRAGLKVEESNLAIKYFENMTRACGSS